MKPDLSKIKDDTVRSIMKQLEPKGEVGLTELAFENLYNYIIRLEKKNNACNI